MQARDRSVKTCAKAGPCLPPVASLSRRREVWWCCGRGGLPGLVAERPEDRPRNLPEPSLGLKSLCDQYILRGALRSSGGGCGGARDLELFGCVAQLPAMASDRRKQCSGGQSRFARGARAWRGE